jgi:PIN domain nuclease of toxin-antitoxin system
MALVAALAHEPAQAEVERLLRSTQDPPRIAAVNLAEVVDVLVRVRSFPSKRVEEAVTWLQAGGLGIVDTDDVIALHAGGLRARHYHRQTCPVSLCDCVGLATAQHLGEKLATGDSALASIARAERVPLIPLQNSKGKRP